MRYLTATLAILSILAATTALAEDFETVKGKVYKDATVNRVEADGIVVKTKSGISKIYFVELPKDVQQRFRPSPAGTGAPHQDQSRQGDKGGWTGLLGVSTSPLRLIAIAAVIILGLVLVIVRSRS